MTDSPIGGEHATTINGNGYDPGLKDILAVADDIGLNQKRAKRIALQISETVNEMLSEYIREK